MSESIFVKPTKPWSPEPSEKCADCGKAAKHSACGMWLCDTCYDKLIHPDNYKPRRCLGCITLEQLKELEETGKIKELKG